MTPKEIVQGIIRLLATYEGSEIVLLEELEVLLKDAVTEFYRAVDKHPLWPESLVDDTNEEHLRRAKQRIENEICKNRTFNDRDGGKFSTAETVFLEEWFEFLEAAVIKRDLVAARHELAQCMAMLLRIGVHLDDYLSEDEQCGGENEQ